MPVITVNLAISAEEFVKLYQGSVHQVLAYASDGRRVRFPARILQPYVTRQGVHGRFAIHFDASGRFQSVERLSS